MASEAASLFVKVTGDISDASKALSHIEGATKKTGGVLQSALGTAIGFGAATIGLNAVGGAMGMLSQGAIGMNAQLETSTLQFTTLMGSSEKAEKKVASLFDFAAKTPFESGPIIKASRIMQTFGGDTLNTDKNLRLFGDAAAAVSAPIDDVSFWMSRAYAAIQGGQPFGEARMRLMELGIITPQVASKMEEMQKKGAKASDLWGVMTGELGKFNGAMNKQAGTWEGLTSTMMDTINMTLAKGFKPLFEGFKGLIGGFNEFMSQPAVQGGIESFSNTLVSVFGAVAGTIKTLIDVIGGLVSAAMPLISAGADIVKAFVSIFNVLAGGDDIVSGFKETFSNLGEKVATFGQTLLSGIATAIGQVVPALADLAHRFIEWIGPMIPPMLEALGNFVASMLGWIISKLPDVAATLAVWAGAFIGWIASDVLPKLPGALLAFGSAVVGWVQNKAVPLIGPAFMRLAQTLSTNLMTGLGALPGLLLGFVTNTLIPAFMQWGPKLVKAGADLAGQLGRAFANGIAGLMEGAINAIIRGINRFQIHFGGVDLGPLGKVGRIDWGGLRLAEVRLPRFEKGAWDIPRATLGLLHPGEMVLPAPAAAAYRAGGGGTVIVYVQGNTIYADNPRSVDALGDRLAARVRAATVRS